MTVSKDKGSCQAQRRAATTHECCLMAAGAVAKVSDVQAQTWTAADETLWASVVSPFVLVQVEKKALH